MTFKLKFTTTHFSALEQRPDPGALEAVERMASHTIAAANEYRSLPEATDDSLAKGAKIVSSEELRSDLSELKGGLEMALRKRPDQQEGARFTRAEVALMQKLEIAEINLNSDPNSQRRRDLMRSFEAGTKALGAGNSITMSEFMQREITAAEKGLSRDRVTIRADHSGFKV